MVIVTRSSHPQAAKPEEIASKIQGKRSMIINSVPEAIKVAIGFGRPVIIAGSLFVVAEALEAFDVSKG
jgi:folylpolyglutamate synthase/dihydropteroate synthase